MGKTEITWIGLIKVKLNELKKQGKSPSIGDVTPEAKKEWVQIKEGNHPKYIQGKAKTVRRKSKGSKGSKGKKGKIKYVLKKNGKIVGTFNTFEKGSRRYHALRETCEKQGYDKC